MTTTGRTGRITGLLLAGLLATGLIAPYVVLRPLTIAPAAFLEAAAGMSTAVRLSVLQLVVGAALSVAVSVAAYSVFRERNRGLSLWVLALAVANFTLQLVENSHWLTMLSVSQSFALADASLTGQFHTLGIVIRAGWKWAHYSHIFVVVAWLFMFFLLLSRTAAVPRALPAVGMGLCVLHFIGITLPVFAGYRMPFPMLYGMPLAFGILATAAWLIANGYREPNARAGTAEAAPGTHSG